MRNVLAYLTIHGFPATLILTFDLLISQSTRLFLWQSCKNLVTFRRAVYMMPPVEKLFV